MKNKVKEKLDKIDNKTLYYSIIIILMITLLVPIFMVAKYNHPSADDYDYAILTHETVLNGGNIFDVIKSAVTTSLNFMQTWQGLYSSAFLLALQPSIFGESFYIFTTYIVIASLFIGIFSLTKTIFKYIFKSDSKKYWFISILILFIYVQILPSPVEGFYWYNGSMNYEFFLAVLLIEIAQFIKYYNTRKIKNIIFATILAFILSGGNHITAFAGILFSLAFLIISILKKKKWYYSIIPLISGIVGFIINATAPGTAIRHEAINYEGSIVKTILTTVTESINTMSNFTNLSIILIGLVLCIILFKELKNVKIRFRTILITGIVFYIIYSGMMCAPLYATGGYGGFRVYDIYCITYIIMFLTMTCMIGSYIISYIDQKKLNHNSNKINNISLVILFFIILFISKTGTTNEAIRELKSGELEAYDAIMNERIDTYINNENKNLQIDSINVRPYLIYFDDITEDPNDWRNKSLTSYYNKESIVIKKNI